MCNENLCAVAFVLDRSGSMCSMQDQAIAGYNDFLQNQIQYPGDTRFSLTLFNDQIQQVAHWVPVQEMVRLNTDSYIPSGNTALDDAVGITIDSLGAELAKMPEHERPGKVIVAILTDGQENSSLRYTTKKVASMIRRQTKHYQWEFLFLGAGPNVERESSARGISSLDTLCFEPTPEGISEVMSNLNFNVNQRKRR